MTATVTLALPDTVADRARAIAARTDRRIEDVLIEWLGLAAADVPVESLPDDQVLALRDSQMSDEQQEEMSRLLTGQRERTLSASDRTRLDDLLAMYRHGLIRKARALKVAVERGLQPPLGAA
jgi:hypothetical protein